MPIGNAIYFDTSAGAYYSMVARKGSTASNTVLQMSGSPTMQFSSVNAPAPGAGDLLRVSLVYEVA
jgi:hypothetical protein